MDETEINFGAIASDQCRVVAHLALNIAKVHLDKCAIFASNMLPSIHEFHCKETASIMDDLGDILNIIDAVSEEDEWMNPIFQRAHTLFPRTGE